MNREATENRRNEEKKIDESSEGKNIIQPYLATSYCVLTNETNNRRKYVTDEKKLGIRNER